MPNEKVSNTMKCRPTKMPITKALVESKEYGWAIVSGIFEVALAADKGTDYWCCGNTICAVPLPLKSGRLPRVCARCGNEIDWSGIKTRVIKVCPSCNKQGLLEDLYCDMHVPAVRLVNKEVPL